MNASGSGVPVQCRRSALFVARATLPLVLTVTAWGAPWGVVAASSTPLVQGAAVDLRTRGWMWPLDSVRIDRMFLAPAHAYGAGHRGIDLISEVGEAVNAPADGTVAFVGEIAGRGIVTIDHGDGLVTTLEPVHSALSAGAAVVRGQAVATVDLGGHATPSSVHFGVRLHGEYINPLLLLDEVPRAVLLPCC